MQDQDSIFHGVGRSEPAIARRQSRRHRLWWLGLLSGSMLLAVGLAGAEAAGYYFAAHGNDSHPCTLAQPCRSIQKITTLLKSAQPGDVFHLRGGDTFEGDGTGCLIASNVNGLPGQPITITSYGTGRAVVQNCGHGFKGTRTDWWVIKNLEITNAHWGITCVGCQDWVISNNLLHNLGSVCGRLVPHTGTVFTPSARWRIHHNVCHDTGVAPRTNGEGFYLISTHDITFEHNELFNLRDEGVNCKQQSRNIVIRHNYFHNFFPSGASDFPEDGFLSRFAKLVAGWLLPQARAGMTRAEDTAIHCRFQATANVTAERNLIEQMPTTSIRMYKLQTAVARYNLLIGSGFRAIDYADGVTGQIANNTIYNNKQAHRISVPITPQDDIAWGNESGNDPTDPQFVNAAGGDFNLAAHSDRINAGSDRLSQGVFHSPTLKTCAVRSVSTNTVRCEVGPIRFGPLRCPDRTAFTIKVNGVARQPTAACTRVTNAIIDIRFQGAGAQPGDLVTLSASYGALQDSAWVGGRTLDGTCLAAPFVCNSMSLPVTNIPVVN